MKSTNQNFIAVKIETFQKPIVLCAVYWPPKSDLQYLHQIGEDLKAINTKFKTNSIWCGGDFNLPDIDWNMNIITGHQYPKILNETFLDMINDLHLEQLIDFPTRKGNYLDLVLTNNPSLVIDINDLPGLIDHTNIPSLNILCHPHRLKQIPRTILLWRQANIAASKESLKVEIESFCENYEAESVENQWSQFKNIANNALKEIPTKSTSSRFNQPWFTRKCNSLVKRTKRLYRRAKQKNI